MGGTVRKHKETNNQNSPLLPNSTPVSASLSSTSSSNSGPPTQPTGGGALSQGFNSTIGTSTARTIPSPR